MRDDGPEQLLDVVGGDEVASVHQRPRPCHAFEREAAAYRRANLDGVERTRRADELDGPLLQQGIDVDLLHRLEDDVQVRESDDGSEGLERMPVKLRVHNRAAPRPASGSRARCG